MEEGEEQCQGGWEVDNRVYREGRTDDETAGRVFYLYLNSPSEPSAGLDTNTEE